MHGRPFSVTFSNIPGAQWPQATAASPDTFPSGHAVHSADPPNGVDFPGGQATHDFSFG